MPRIHALIILTSLFVFQSEITIACENFKSYSPEEIKEYRDMLRKSDADSIDRLFAFKQLICSDNPNLRHYAIKEGLKVSDPLVRNQVMLKAMMQKERIDIELHSNNKLTPFDKRFIADNSGIFSIVATFRSETKGCISLHTNAKSCGKGNVLFIKGDKIEYNYSSYIGAFELSKNGSDLVGFLRVGNTKKYSRIPAIIKLL